MVLYIHWRTAQNNLGNETAEDFSDKWQMRIHLIHLMMMIRCLQKPGRMHLIARDCKVAKPIKFGGRDLAGQAWSASSEARHVQQEGGGEGQGGRHRRSHLIPRSFVSWQLVSGEADDASVWSPPWVSFYSRCRRERWPGWGSGLLVPRCEEGKVWC